MNSEALAKRVVALGVGYSRPFSDGTYFCIDSPNNSLPADEFINDGRVVLAMMEKCHSVTVRYMEAHNQLEWWATARTVAAGPHGKGIRITLAPAIIEACVKALEQANEQ